MATIACSICVLSGYRRRVVYVIGNLIIGMLALQPRGTISTVQLIQAFPVLVITFLAHLCTPEDSSAHQSHLQWDLGRIVGGAYESRD